MVHPEKVTRREKRKKNRMGIAKLFPLNANANAKKKTRMAIAKLFALNANANRFIVRSKFLRKMT